MTHLEDRRIASTDICVVGAGCAGLFAACHAAEEGAQVVLIDVGKRGVGIRSSALAAVDSSYQRAAGVHIDKTEIINDIVSYASGFCNMDLIKQWADHSGEAVDWYGKLIEPHGYTICLEYNMPSATRYRTWPTGHGTALASDTTIRINEAGVTDALLAHFGMCGGTFMGNTRMDSLICDEDRVVGVHATTEGGPCEIYARKGVIIATGGYANNEKMFSERNAPLMKSIAHLLCFANCRGDGIQACLDAGAAMSPLAGAMLFDRGVVKSDQEIGHPYENPPFKHVTFATQPFLKVNHIGHRFCNESSPYDFVAHAASRFEDGGWYPIWDSSWKEDVKRFHTVGCSTLGLIPGGNNRAPRIDTTEQELENLVESGHVVKADTLADLADALGFDDKAGFEEEVRRYNELYDMGKDVDYGKEPFRLSRIDESPYYGMRVGGEILCTLDGVTINEKYQVLRNDCSPIDGLYAVGNDSAGFFGHTYPNFSAGLCAGKAVTQGMICGRALAHE